DSKVAVQVTKTNGAINIVSEQGQNQIVSRSPYALQASGVGTVINLSALQGENKIIVNYQNSAPKYSHVLWAEKEGTINLTGLRNTLSNEVSGGEKRSLIFAYDGGKVNIHAMQGDNHFALDPYNTTTSNTEFVYAQKNSQVAINAENGKNYFQYIQPSYSLPTVTKLSESAALWVLSHSKMTLNAQENIFNFIVPNEQAYSFKNLIGLNVGVTVQDKEGYMTFSAVALTGNNDLKITAQIGFIATGIQTARYSQTYLEAKNGYNSIFLRNTDKTTDKKLLGDFILSRRGIDIFQNGQVTLLAQGNYIDVGGINVYQRIDGKTTAPVYTYGALLDSNSQLTIEALTENNQIILSQDDDEIPPYPIEAQPNLYAIVANTGSSVYLKALKGYNQIAINPQKMSPKYLITRLNGIFTGDV
ncbi:hypothetical protein, partial [Gallibacterium salpingitidis]